MTAIYLTEPGTVVRCTNETLAIACGPRRQVCRLAELSLVVVLPGVQLTSVAIATLLDRGIETLFLTQDGQFRGRLQGQFPTNPAIRLAQYRTVETSFGLAIARKFVEGKIRNQRAILQRRHREVGGQVGPLAEAIDAIAASLMQLRGLEHPDRDTLMGLEGISARNYYQSLPFCLPAHWGFAGRNRQPPLDPVNALLSWGYGVLLSRVFAACVQAGLDPYLGLLHATLPYRPNLVLDMMEEFRPILVDRAAIAIANNGLLSREDFVPAPEGEGIWLGAAAKKLFLIELERRFSESSMYSPQNRRLKLSAILLEQARSLARSLVECRLDYEPYLIK